MKRRFGIKLVGMSGVWISKSCLSKKTYSIGNIPKVWVNHHGALNAMAMIMAVHSGQVNGAMQIKEILC